MGDIGYFVLVLQATMAADFYMQNSHNASAEFGAVDGSLIPIKAPHYQAHLFVHYTTSIHQLGIKRCNLLYEKLQ